MNSQAFTQNLKVCQWVFCQWQSLKVKQCKVTVPVSQLVLPVGVTGLTVKGKTPTPEPRSIVVARSRPGSENVVKTHRFMVFCFNKTQFSITHKHRMELVQLACTQISLLLWVGWWWGEVAPGSQPRNSAIWCTIKRSSAQPAPWNLHSHWWNAHLWTPWLAKEQRHTAKTGKQVRLQCKIPRETTYHHCMFINPHKISDSYFLRHEVIS